MRRVSQVHLHLHFLLNSERPNLLATSSHHSFNTRRQQSYILRVLSKSCFKIFLMTSLQWYSGQKVQALLAVQHDRGLLEWPWMADVHGRHWYLCNIQVLFSNLRLEHAKVGHLICQKIFKHLRLDMDPLAAGMKMSQNCFHAEESC